MGVYILKYMDLQNAFAKHGEKNVFSALMILWYSEKDDCSKDLDASVSTSTL